MLEQLALKSDFINGLLTVPVCFLFYVAEKICYICLKNYFN